MFVVEYCGQANANATQAAKNAGYGGRNVTRASLQVTGSMLLAKSKIRKAILTRWDALTAPSEEILKRMTDDARLDMSGLITLGDGVAMLNLTEENLRLYGPLIKEIETDPETKAVVRVRLNDSQAARRDLARIRRLFSDNPIINIFHLQEMPSEELQKRLAALRTQIVAGRARGGEGGRRLGGRDTPVRGDGDGNGSSPV